MARLGDYVKIKTGKLDANASSPNGQYPFFTCSVEPLRIDTYSYDCECALVAGNGDLNVKYYNGKFDAYQRTYIIESNDKIVLSVPYLYCFLDKYVEELRKQSIGGVIKYIKLGNLTEAQIPMCAIEEQKKIVANLNQVNALISLRKQQLAKLDELVKSRFIEMFGDVSTNPYDYPIKNFDEISILITDGEHATPRRTDKGIYLLSARNILNHMLQLKDVDYIDEDEYNRIARRVIPQAGDVLISCSGSIGRCCVVPDELKFQMVRSAALIRFDKTINPVFAEWLITSDDLQQQIAQSATQSSQSNLFQGKIRKLHGYVPPIELQNQFAAFVEQVGKSKLEIQKSLEKLETLKKALMQKYFG